MQVRPRSLIISAQMRVVLQRVSQARVRVDGQTVGEICDGLLALVGVTHRTRAKDARAVAGQEQDFEFSGTRRER